MLELEDSWFKPHCALGQALGPNLATRLLVTFGLNIDKNPMIVRLSPQEWPKGGRGAAR